MLSEVIARTIPLLPRPLVERVAARYVAGGSEASAVALATALRRQGFVTTVDMLGEDATSMDRAQVTVDAYASLMRAMIAARLDRNISIKLTQLGLRLQPERSFKTLRGLLEMAAEWDFFIRFDMEDASVTDVTLDFYRRARKIWPRVGPVLQSRLRRTVDDARQLAAEAANIRLCKGIYPESPEIAFTRPDEIRQSYVTALELLLDAGCYVGVATHDPALLDRAAVLAGEPPLEFQALLGVPIRTRLERLRDTGFTVRIYVPFGADWYAYGLRRLRENPQVAAAIARSLFSRDRLSTQVDGDDGQV